MGTGHPARWSRWIAVLAVAVGVTVVGSPTMAGARDVSPSARADVPTATGLSPSSGPAVGGTAVTLTGTNFVPGSTDIVVAFTSGGQATIPASDVRVDSTGTVASFTTVAHPRAAGGPAGFFPRTAAGRSATPQVFTYVPATPPPLPTATGLSPSSGPAVGGTAVTLTGTNFVPGSTDIVVAFTSGGQATIPASDVRVDSTGTAASFTTVAHPRAAGGPAGFFPRTAAGRSATPQVFTYLPANGATPRQGGQIDDPPMSPSERRDLPATGSASSLLLLLAVSALTVGCALVGVARRTSERAPRT